MKEKSMTEFEIEEQIIDPSVDIGFDIGGEYAEARRSAVNLKKR